MMKDLEETLAALRPLLQVSLDPVALVDRYCKMLHATPSMKRLLGFRARQSIEGEVICDHLKLMICQKGCSFRDAIRDRQGFRHDEVPAVRSGDKLRLIVSAMPIFVRSEKEPVGLIISMRDTTAEVLLQAKYHKVSQLLEDKQSAMDDLRKKVDSLRLSLREMAMASRR